MFFPLLSASASASLILEPQTTSFDQPMRDVLFQMCKSLMENTPSLAVDFSGFLWERFHQNPH